ncbi:MAG: serine/threonine protein kinase, partial [Suipraeoptans sp.]
DGNYKILRELGRGGMSIVYMAINETANKTWAIKEVRKDGVLDFESVKQGLIVETEMLKRLQHVNLPSIVDIIEDKTVFLIVMDYIEGNSLGKSLEEYGAQPQELVIEWAKQLCDVLGYLHTREPSVIYRDMKPSNIMLKPDGNLSLIDFGTAREYKEKNIEDTTCLGTIGYAAPEQFGGVGQTDARTDIYCLGATIFHLITGINPSEPPYEIKPIREINSELSGGLELIIQKCLRRNPNDRYQSAAEMMYALEHYEEIDDYYKKMQKRRLALFVIVVILSIAFTISGVGLNTMAEQKAEDTYEAQLDEAKKTSDYTTKIDLYEKCIEMQSRSNKLDAYMGLIQAYKENDSVFSVDEAQQLETLIKNNRTELLESPQDYTEIAFETGKLFWYYYNYGEDNPITRAKSSVEWFQVVIDNASDDYEQIGMARTYASIGMFFRDIHMNVAEANDKGKYRPLFDNMTELLNTVALVETESEVVRLEVLELSRTAIMQYSTKFKVDDVSEEELLSMYNEIVSILNTIEVPENDATDVRTIKSNSIKSLLDETEKSIEIAYIENKGVKEDER